MSLANWLGPAVLLGFLSPAAGLIAADCSAPPTGFPPLNDPFLRSYQGVALGLYPDGANQRPAQHDQAGLRLAGEVVPRDAAGRPDPEGGRIVFLSIGMSNTTQEFSVFKRLADEDLEKDPRVVIVDGAQGGWSADRIVRDGERYWQTVTSRLAAAGVTPAQVQTAWMKQAHPRPTLPFPEDARHLQADLKAIALTLKSRFPNLRLLYLSSRIYAGYASTSLNPEPFAYQSAFAVRWLIEEQIRGEPALSYDAGRAPWLAWGPYLWADGLNAREDGLTWRCEDFAEDGTHPAESGRRKVAELLLDFVKSDSTARMWFRRKPAGPPSKPVAAAVVNAAAYTRLVAPGSIASVFGSELAAAEMAARGVPLPTALGGTMVLIGGEPAGLYYVSPSQVNLVVPWAPRGDHLVVVREDVASEPLTVPLSSCALGVFPQGGDAGGAAAVHPDGSLVTPEHPARRGEAIGLYLTGMGVRDPLILLPEVIPAVRLAASTVPVDSSGRVPGRPGLDQVVFTVPHDAPAGDGVPLSVLVPPCASNTTALAVAP